MLPRLFELAGLVPFDEWGGGAAEPVAWILGGNLNLGENTIINEMKNTSLTTVANAWIRCSTQEVFSSTEETWPRRSTCAHSKGPPPSGKIMVVSPTLTTWS